MDAVDDITPVSVVAAHRAEGRSTKAAELSLSMTPARTSSCAMLSPTITVRKRKKRSVSIVNAANSRLQSELPETKQPTKTQSHSLQADVKPLVKPSRPSPLLPTTSLPPAKEPLTPPILPPVSGGRRQNLKRDKDGEKTKNNDDATQNNSCDNHSRVNKRNDAKRKGLRHFAVRVCRKVEEKGTTTYNEVADELVHEERTTRGSTAKQTCVDDVVDEKNIRRRVYDSLNVLMAMGILAKDRKKISWQGLSAAYACASDDNHLQQKGSDGELRTATDVLRERVIAKRDDAVELFDQLRRMEALVHRRRAEESLRTAAIAVAATQESPSTGNVWTGRVQISEQQKLSPPFMIVRAGHKTNIDLTMDESREEVSFTFDASFAVFDDREILRRLPLLPETVFIHNENQPETDFT